MHATPAARKPWIAEAQAAGRTVPTWIAERANSREQFEQWMALRERAFPATRPGTLTLAQAAERVQLDPAEVAWACEQHGRCDTDDFIVLGANDGDLYIVARRSRCG